MEASVEGSLSASAERLVCRHAVARVAEPRRRRTGALGVVVEAYQAQDAMSGSPLASWYEPLTPEPKYASQAVVFRRLCGRHRRGQGGRRLSKGTVDQQQRLVGEGAAEFRARTPR